MQNTDYFKVSGNFGEFQALSNSKQAAMYANKGSLMYAGLFEGNVKITQQLAIGTNSKSGYMLSVKGNTGIDGKNNTGR